MQQQNSQKIKAAFERYRTRKDQFIVTRFSELMNLGLQAVLDAHDNDDVVHHHNEDETQTLGWMLFHDGVEVASDYQKKGPVTGEILMQLESEGCATKGWVCVLMSSLTFSWYNVDYEQMFMNDAMDEIEDQYKSILIPLQ